MTPLSPAAQAIWDAWNDAYEAQGPLEDMGQLIAAAIRAAADQVVPCGPKPSANSDSHLMNWTKSLDQYYQRQQTRVNSSPSPPSWMAQLPPLNHEQPRLPRPVR